MKNFTRIIFLFIAIILMAVMAQASPYLVCDPQVGVTTYEVTGWTPSTITAQPDGSLRVDVAEAVQGTTYNLTVAACNVWGCSVTVPFVLQKQLPGAPTGLRLVP